MLKGTRFKSVDAVKAKATELMNKLSEDDLQHCFQQWNIRIERCGDRGEEYIEGDNISVVFFLIKSVLPSVRLFYSHTTYVYCKCFLNFFVSSLKHVSFKTDILGLSYSVLIIN